MLWAAGPYFNSILQMLQLFQFQKSQKF